MERLKLCLTFSKKRVEMFRLRLIFFNWNWFKNYSIIIFKLISVKKRKQPQTRPPGRGYSHALQCSCLENPMDRGTRWATVHSVTKSRTWLKWLSTNVCLLYKKIMFLMYHHLFWSSFLSIYFMALPLSQPST